MKRKIRWMDTGECPECKNDIFQSMDNQGNTYEAFCPKCEWEWGGVVEQHVMRKAQKARKKVFEGNQLYDEEKYDEANNKYRDALIDNPELNEIKFNIGNTQYKKKKYEEAIAELQKAVNIAGDYAHALGWLGSAYGYSGQTGEALKILSRLNKLSKERYIPSISKAWLCMGVGDNDQVFEHLEKAYLERDSYLIFLNTYPDYDKLRSDSRFTALLKKIGFEE